MKELKGEIKIRRVETIAEYQSCERLQKKVWGRHDLQVVPLNQLVAAQMAGGLVLGAFDKNDNLVGFVYGFPGVMDGKPVHYSHMLGVDPRFWSKNIGYRLKLEQREHALSQGIDLIVWTFDPLEPVNAALNFRKLGVVSDRYEVNLYGIVKVKRYKDLETDRLLVKWFIRSERVAHRLAGEVPAVTIDLERLKVNSTRYDEKGLLRFAGADLSRQGPYLCFEIPESFQAIKGADLEAARAWREGIREICLHYLGKGYQLLDFFPISAESRRRNFYLLGEKSDVPT